MSDTDKLDKILTLLRGNELDKNDNGIVGKINDMDTRLYKLEMTKNRLFWILIGMSFPTGIGIGKLIDIIK